MIDDYAVDGAPSVAILDTGTSQILLNYRKIGKQFIK